ncbi:MAG: TIGR03619 family F420-dependent LLM class oxidoreductase [Dehalococcoidia bacterium]|nr:TIGR03619 family F420-dependent LLM class oxidoreductase [Dehalococcoidia bacterium]
MQMPKIFAPARGSDDGIIEWARAVEAAGVDGVFVGDHVTFYGSGSDALIRLAPIAAATSTLALQTCVYLLALRHPTPVALQAAMVDQLSDGRLVLGVGIGGEDPDEWWACGIDPKTRARRTDESLQVLRSLWTQDETTFDGRYYQLDRVRMRPKPHRRGGVVLQVGGRSDAALRRTARYADGWTGIWVSTRRFAEAGEKIASFAREAGRAGTTFTRGMQFWMGVDADRQTARAKVADSMEAFYRLPFEQFEKYTPYGGPDEIAEFIAPYVEAGCAHVNLVIADDPDAVLERTLAVQEALRRIAPSP